MSFAEYFRQKAPAGRISLRRAQFKSAIGGNVMAQIWLGKQMLGQRDFREPGNPIEDPQSVVRGIRQMVDALFATAPIR